jgi:hypothetical protein
MKTLENTLSPRTSPLNHTRQTAAWSIQTAFAMLFAVLYLERRFHPGSIPGLARHVV